MYLQLFSFLFFIYGLKFFQDFNIKVYRIFSIVLFFASFLFLYYSLDTVINTPYIIKRDIADFFRPFIYAFIASFPFIFPVKQEDFKEIIKFSLILIFIQIFMNILVFIPGLDLFVKAYRPQHFGINYFRFSGTFGYAYTFSAFMTFVLLYAIFFYTQYSGENKTKLMLLVDLIFLSIVLSGSRAGLGGIIIVLLILFLFERQKVVKLLFIKLIFIFALIVVFFVYIGIDITIVQKIVDNIKSLLEKGVNDPSAGHRFAELLLTKEILEKNFWLGAGSNKFIFNVVKGLHLESLYAYYLAKWGFLGFMIYNTQIFLVWLLSKKVESLYIDNIYISSLAKAMKYWIFALYIFGLSISFVDSYRGPFIFYLLVGYLLYFYILRKINLKEKESNEKNINAN